MKIIHFQKRVTARIGFNGGFKIAILPNVQAIKNYTFSKTSDGLYRAQWRFQNRDVT